jgi:hypothetical protein
MLTGTIPVRSCIAAALGALLLVACSEVAPTGPPNLGPELLINGSDDFDRAAVGAIMVYNPNHPGKPGWRSFCTASLIHQRVLTTAGHCIQGIQRQVAAGIMQAVWISFQQDPLAHFNTPPSEGDPASGGWYAIESLHDNPVNPDFSVFDTDFDAYLAMHPDFHDSGAIILKERVKGVQPLKLPSRPGEVEALLGRAGCVDGSDCGLVGVGYGLREFPPPFMPFQARQSAPLRYKGLDALWVRTYQLVSPGSALGAVCFGDSGGPVVLQKNNGNDRTIVGIISEVEDPLLFETCAGSVAALHYRTDTREHLDFSKAVILQSLRGGPN